MKNLLLLCCLLGAVSLSHAQLTSMGSTPVRHFTKADYQGGTQNWAIIQDERGILYVGNNEGLLEYDGVRWRSLALPNRTIVRSLAFNPAGQLLVGGQDDMGVLQADSTGGVSFRSLVSLIPAAHQKFEDVWNIFSLEDGSSLFCTRNALFHHRGDRMEVVLPRGTFEQYFELEGHIYVRESQRGLLKWQAGALEPMASEGYFVDTPLAGMLPFDEQRMLVVTSSKGLYLLGPEGPARWETPASDFLNDFEAYCALKLQDGRFAIGTVSHGLLILNRNGEPEQLYDKSRGLQNNTVLSLYQDRHENLFLGLDNGLDYLQISSPFTYLSSEAGIEGSGYASRVFDGRLYMGTNQGLFYHDWPIESDPLSPGAFRRSRQVEGQVWSLEPAGEQLFLGMHEGAFLINDNRPRSLSTVQGAWTFCELAAHPGYAVEGTYSGLLLYEQSSSENGIPGWSLVKRLDGFDESARILVEDADGSLWISHAYRGLYRLRIRPETASIEEARRYGTADGLPDDLFINVSSIQGEVIFTTPSGIYYFEEEQQTFLEQPELTEIFGKQRYVRRLLEDELGNIWFSMEDEFGVVSVRETGIFNEVNQQFFNQFHDQFLESFEHIYAADSQHVFIATEKGFLLYNPDKGAVGPDSFEVAIRQLTVLSSREIDIWKGGVPSGSASASPPAFDPFPTTTNSFRFRCAALYMEKSDEMSYRYQLVGYDAQWTAWAPKAEKEYTNLPHGDYTFMVQARNARNQRSRIERFSFSILPPWYATTWAKVAYVLLGLMLAYGVTRFYDQKLKRETQALQRQQEEELKQQQVQHKQEVARNEAEIIRIRNEKLKADISHKNSELASATMHLVQRGEILQKIKDQLNGLLPELGAPQSQRVVELIKNIDESSRLDEEWDQFVTHFDQVHQNFFKDLRAAYPMLTPKDQKLCAYLRMNLSTKEIAPLMNISVRGVEISRYRLRKKLELEPDVNLVDFMMKF